MRTVYVQSIKLLAVCMAVLKPLPHGHAYASSETPALEAEEDSSQKEEEQKKADGYVHSWIAFPTLTGKDPSNTSLMKSYKAPYGEITVAVYLASWCIPCQNIMNKIMLLEKKYQPFAIKFIYVFSHDVPQDALSFKENFKLENTLLPDDATLQFFFNPPLPSIFVGDRYGWFTKRFNSTSLAQLGELDDFLAILSVY